MPGDSDFADLGLAGFGAAAVNKLRAQAATLAPEAAAARDALALLVRLVGRSA